MKIKMNPEETAQMLKAFEHPHFTNTVNYVTAVEVDPDWVREVLPAPLEPDAPVVTFALSQGDQFAGLVCGLQCKYDNLVGSWGLSYTMDTDLAIIYGREGLAEPKNSAPLLTRLKMANTSAPCLVLAQNSSISRRKSEKRSTDPR